jgi:hypothetical protein
VKLLRSISIGIVLVLLAATCASAVPTRITVHVLAKDSKFLGTSMGGARVTIKDAHSLELLAEGFTSGSTGDTQRIMETPLWGKASLSTEETARFTATIDIESPRLIEVTAYGPMANLQGANKVSATQWVVPGKHITGGDAWLMILPGLIVDVLAPPAHMRFEGPQQTVKVEANVTMMCGCPLTPGGHWDADKMEVAALLKRDGQEMGLLALRYAGTPSQFEGAMEVRGAGVYEATVYAYDPASGNTGLDSTTFIIE